MSPPPRQRPRRGCGHSRTSWGHGSGWPCCPRAGHGSKDKRAGPLQSRVLPRESPGRDREGTGKGPEPGFCRGSHREGTAAGSGGAAPPGDGRGARGDELRDFFAAARTGRGSQLPLSALQGRDSPSRGVPSSLAARRKLCPIHPPPAPTPAQPHGPFPLLLEPLSVSLPPSLSRIPFPGFIPSLFCSPALVSPPVPARTSAAGTRRSPLGHGPHRGAIFSFWLW